MKQYTLRLDNTRKRPIVILNMGNILDGDSVYVRHMGDAIFKIPTAAMLIKSVDGIDRLELTEETLCG